MLCHSWFEFSMLINFECAYNLVHWDFASKSIIKRCKLMNCKYRKIGLVCNVYMLLSEYEELKFCRDKVFFKNFKGLTRILNYVLNTLWFVGLWIWEILSWGKQKTCKFKIPIKFLFLSLTRFFFQGNQGWKNFIFLFL